MNKLLDTIGSTDLVRLDNIGEGRIYVKVEKSNPGGSIKDRAALYMIKKAIERGDLKPGMTIVEPTSGNTGIGLALIGKRLGYNVELIMPSTMSVERRKLIESYGGKVILTEEGGMEGSVNLALEKVKSGGYYMPNQFENSDNALAHEETTGPEIYEQLENIGGFIASFGTGGTVTGVGRFLKSQNKDINVWTIEPKESPLLTEGNAGSHGIQGIGANFIPSVLDTDILDKAITVSTKDAINMAKRLSREEGLAVGISAGANVAGALLMAKEIDGPIVTVAPDTSERYLSTDLFK